jgi:polyferredoxin
MIEGVPLAIVYAGAAGVLLVSFAGLVLAGGRLDARSGSYRTFDLLRDPIVRLTLRWPAMRTIAQGFVAALFVLVIGAGLFGQQQAGSNIATLLTWTYWWVLLVLFVIFFGKAWCYICPWDAIAGWLERGRSLGLPWPKSLRNLYPATA